jgi:hypothetical protein
MSVNLASVLLSFAVLAALALAMPGAYAVTETKTTAFEKTTIIEFTNNDGLEAMPVTLCRSRPKGDGRAQRLPTDC